MRQGFDATVHVLEQVRVVVHAAQVGASWIGEVSRKIAWSTPFTMVTASLAGTPVTRLRVIQDATDTFGPAPPSVRAPWARRTRRGPGGTGSGARPSRFIEQVSQQCGRIPVRPAGQSQVDRHHRVDEHVAVGKRPGLRLVKKTCSTAGGTRNHGISSVDRSRASVVGRCAIRTGPASRRQRASQLVGGDQPTGCRTRPRQQERPAERPIAARRSRDSAGEGRDGWS